MRRAQVAVGSVLPRRQTQEGEVEECWRRLKGVRKEER